MSKYNPMSKEFQENAKKLGLTGYQYVQKLREEGELPDITKINRKCKEDMLKRLGYANYMEYCNDKAKIRGFEGSSEYSKVRHWCRGLNGPMSENQDCSQYLSICISEMILSEIFEDIQRTKNNNIGFDFICKKGFKTQAKSGVLLYRENGSGYWQFKIDYNKIPDYFILVAFDNRQDLNPVHIWLIKNNEIIRGRKLNQFSGLPITNEPKYISIFKKYENIDKLEKFKKICDELKSEINN